MVDFWPSCAKYLQEPDCNSVSPWSITHPVPVSSFMKGGSPHLFSVWCSSQLFALLVLPSLPATCAHILFVPGAFPIYNRKAGLSFFCCLVAQSLSDSLRPHGLQHARLPCPSLSSRSLLKRTSIELMMPSNHLILCCLLLLLPSVFPSFRVFSSVLAVRIR